MVKATTFAVVWCLLLCGAATAQGAGGDNTGTQQTGGMKGSSSPDGTDVNPYSGKEVGEPLKPGDLGYGAPVPKTITEE